ncbi:MAG: DNA mismatch repair endonuclease MutL [Bacteroidota bacterium]
MANLIQLLPDHVANQIAAGEVIQRPASVIKELVENAIDSGATEVKLVIRDAGKTLIQVIDNGCGMNEIDARMSFERHATSKIRSADDIFKILTKGFRGEALASIAAIAQVELKTRQHDSELGTQIIIEGSVIKGQQPVQSSQGTSFAVKNLFFNTPARRNFLKSETVELKHILEEFLRVALVHNEVGFRLNHNEIDVYSLPAGNMRQRIVSIFGKSFNEKLVPVEQETTIANIRGFVCKPEHSKKTRGEQYLFVNKRFIKSSYLNHAIQASYDELIEKGSFPTYFIHIDVDPASIDINIHPTKTEIKFQDERSLYAIIHAAVKQSLGMYNIAPSLDFESITRFEISPVRNNTEIRMPEIKVNPDYNPFKTSPSGGQGGGRSAPSAPGNPARDWEDLLRVQREFQVPLENEVKMMEENRLIPEEKEEVTQQGVGVCIQLNNAYIVSNIKSGLMMIDQQRAHERVLYERFIKQLNNQDPVSQSTLFPEQIELSPLDYALVLDLAPSLEKAGVCIENFGNNTIVVNGLPAEANQLNARNFIEEMLEQLKHHRADTRLGTKERLALSMARPAAIKSGKKMSQPEMEQLLHELFMCEVPHYTAKGKPVIVTFTREELAKKFD